MPNRIRKLIRLVLWTGCFLLPAMQGSAFTSVEITLNTYLINTPATYTITGHSAAAIIPVGTFINVSFPAGTTFSSLTASDVVVGGSSVAGITLSGTYVTFPCPATISPGGDLVIVFSNNKVVNSTTPGTVSLSLILSWEESGTYVLVTPTPTRTFTRTRTPTCTRTPTMTPTSTPTLVPTITMSPTRSPTPTLTPTPLPSATCTPTSTITPCPLGVNRILSFPSPAQGHNLWFYFNSSQAGRLELVLYNVVGEKVGQMEKELPESGYGHLKWDAGTLAPGIYLYRVRFLDTSNQGTWSGLQKIAVAK